MIGSSKFETINFPPMFDYPLPIYQASYSDTQKSLMKENAYTTFFILPKMTDYENDDIYLEFCKVEPEGLLWIDDKGI